MWFSIKKLLVLVSLTCAILHMIDKPLIKLQRHYNFVEVLIIVFVEVTMNSIIS